MAAFFFGFLIWNRVLLQIWLDFSTNPRKDAINRVSTKTVQPHNHLLLTP